MARLKHQLSSGDRTFELAGEFSIGRLPTNGLALPDDLEVSREHARVVSSAGGYAIQDLDSRNGTFLERGTQKWRVSGTAGLEDGDVIQVGGARLTFEAGIGAEHPTNESTVVPGKTVVGRILPVPRNAPPG